MSSKFFKNHGPFSLREILEITSLKADEASVDLELNLHDIKPLDKASHGDITFFANSKYLMQFKESKASVCIAKDEYKEVAPKGMIVLGSANPYASYAKVLKKFYSGDEYGANIAATAVIAKSAKIDNGCNIGDYVVIGENAEVGAGTVIRPFTLIGNDVKIGKKCLIEASVTITNSIIGDNVIIFSGARIGQDGFGFATDNGKHIKVQHIGSVTIGNDVEIGAGTTIDRGSLDDTVIAEGCRIDNLVQIGHNVKLGRGCVIVAQAGIAGSTEIGDYSVIGGQVGIAGHLTIGKQTTILAKSGITNNIKEDGTFYAGYPAVPVNQWRRQSVMLRKLAKKEVNKDERQSD